MNWYTSSYRKFPYNIITDPSVMLDDPGLDDSKGKEFIALFLKFHIRGVKPIKKLRALVEKYPDSVHFRYLLAEVLSLKTPALAAEEMKELATRFPDHLYGHAYSLLHSVGKEVKGFSLSKPMPELAEAITNRWLFHPSEVFLYENAVLTYLVNNGKGNNIQERLSRLKSMTPNALRPELLDAIASPGKPKTVVEAPQKAVSAKPAAKPIPKAKPIAKTTAKPAAKAEKAVKISSENSAGKPKASVKKPSKVGSKPA